MRTKTWLGGALVLSAALSLAIAGGAWAQSQVRGSTSGSGGYGAGQGTGSGSQYGKQQLPPAGGCKSDGPVGVCAPPAASKKPKPSTSRTPAPQTSK